MKLTRWRSLFACCALWIAAPGCTSTHTPITTTDAAAPDAPITPDAGSDAGGDGGSDAGSDAGAGADCDWRGVLCFGIAPECGDGETPSVIDSCWGPCVRATRCATVVCGDRASCGAEPSCEEGTRAALLMPPGCWGDCVPSDRCVP